VAGDRAIELKPDLAEAYFTRGLSYFYLGKYDEALDNYDQALKIDPKMVPVYNSRGHTHFTRREWDLAVPEYKRAIEIDPNYAPAHQNLATTYVELGQYQLAIEEYDRALALEPENDFARAHRALARARAGEVDGALQDANEALQHADDVNLGRIGGFKATKYISYVARGTAHLRKEDYAAAVASFGDAIKINPKGAQAYYLRAGAYRLAGDTRKADEDYKVALELDPEIETKMKPWLQGSS
jgi:tetratricopeptide (TPR) repeat protein